MCHVKKKNFKNIKNIKNIKDTKVLFIKIKK